jgi:transposase
MIHYHRTCLLLVSPHSHPSHNLSGRQAGTQQRRGEGTPATAGVVGIGFVTAINLIVHTDGFSIMNDARKLACFCGVAPFEYSSGTSVKGKTKVHPMANKKLKCNLHMASLTAVKLDPGLKSYYEIKVAEGKNKLSVLNAVRNKLLARVVSCVNNRKMYVKIMA